MLTTILYSFLYCIGDTNRDNIDPDVLMQGVESYGNESRLDVLYDFLGRYVCKIYTDDLIVRLLKHSVGNSYINIIGPCDIAYVIALVKNGKEVWDQDLCSSATGTAAMATKGLKLNLKFTGGKGQKRIRGKNLWNKEGMTFFQTVEKN